MPPVTRASLAQKASDPVGDAGPQSESSEQEYPIEVYLTRALKSAKKLGKEVSILREQNAELQHKLSVVEEAEIQPRRGKKAGPSGSGLQAEVRKLNSHIQQLEKAKEKDRRKIKQLQMKEIRAEAAELEDQGELQGEVGDFAHRMRKLLRRFHDLMVSTSIEEKEECPVCMDDLEPNKCASLPCEHTFCETCISRLSPGEEQITCPQCRKLCDRESIEVVQYTASQQWDFLLEVATSWAKIDLTNRGEQETSEEEAEEEFIDDEHAETSSNASTTASEPMVTLSKPENEPESVRELNVPPPDEADLPGSSFKRRRIIAISPSLESELAAPAQQDSVTSALPPKDDPNKTQDSFPTPPQSQSGTPGSSQVPPASPRTLYTQTSAAEKRKRLEELAAAKRRKVLC